LGEYPRNFEHDLQMSSEERSMFYSITNDKFLHFLFYFCAVSPNQSGLYHNSAYTLWFPLGLTDKQAADTFLSLFVKIKLVLQGGLDTIQPDFGDLVKKLV
jgi:hypothetical protein